MSVQYMLDTDTVSCLIRGDHVKLNAKVKSQAGNLHMSAITWHELNYGAARRGSPRLVKCISDLLALVDVVHWSSLAATCSAGIRADLERKGTPIGVMDALIAVRPRVGTLRSSPTTRHISNALTIFVSPTGQIDWKNSLQIES